jgi:hypothetical protein
MDLLLSQKAMTRVNGAYEFHRSVQEIQILDVRGRVIWQKKNWEIAGPIRWPGVDTEGKAVAIGDYICKMVYPDGKMAYLPFVFLK